jgi:branched-chain amino acid transport system substrate-binding protein
MGISRRKLLQGAAAAAGVSAAGVPGALLAQSQPIKIGLIYSLSGPYAVAGIPHMRAAQLAIDHYNRNGGLLGRKIETVVRDDKFSGAGSVAAARELSGMGINLFVGGGSSVAALGVMPLLAEMKAVMTMSGTAAMAVTHESFSRNAFRVLANANMQYGGLGSAMAKQFPNVMKWQSIVPDSSFGRDAAKTFSSNLRMAHPKANSRDFEIKETILVSATASDFRQQVNQMMNSGVEGVFCAVVGAGTMNFFQQARAVGLHKKLKVLCEAQGDTTAIGMGKDNFPFWGPAFWPYQFEPTKSNKLSQQFLKDWAAAYKENEPSTTGVLAYRAATALLEGIKRSKSTEADKIIPVMEDMQFDTPTGPFKLRKKDHQSIGSLFFGEYVPSDKAPYFMLKSVKAVDEETVVEPPSPGAEYLI